MEKNIPFNEYLEKNNKDKFVIAITKSQYVIKMGMLTHEMMIKYLIDHTRPDIKKDYLGNYLTGSEPYNNSNIIMLGYGNYALIELPKEKMLSPEQFECLKEILLKIENYNKKIDSQGWGKKFELIVYANGFLKIDYENFQDNINELISKIEEFVKEPLYIKPEIIIGTPIISKEKMEKLSLKTQEELMLEKMLNEMNEYVDGNNKQMKKSQGFSSISLIILVTSLISIGILVLGIIINT